MISGQQGGEFLSGGESIHGAAAADGQGRGCAGMLQRQGGDRHAAAQRRSQHDRQEGIAGAGGIHYLAGGGIDMLRLTVAK